MKKISLAFVLLFCTLVLSPAQEAHMAQAFDVYPASNVIIRLEYDDAVPIGTYDDPFLGTIDVYAVVRVHYENLTGNSYEIEVEGNNQFPRNFTIGPFEVGDNGSIPPPQRFANFPITIKRALER